MTSALFRRLLMGLTVKRDGVSAVPCCLATGDRAGGIRG